MMAQRTERTDFHKVKAAANRHGLRRWRGAARPDDSPRWRQSLRCRLLSWYRRHARDLPWRGTRDPYSVWVSEIMLQQTQVATVIPYFDRFLARFPSVAALDAAREEDVLRLWEGLGYYRRARQLHRAARIVMAEHSGRFPRDVKVVRRLPGIGRYTAGAILSIAFDARLPILEANTLRLLSRLIGYRGDVRNAAGQRVLWNFAEQLLPARRCGDFNQALMELGSQVCTPRNPACDACPLAPLCAARACGLVNKIPKATRKPRVEAVREAVVVVRRGRRVLLVRRGDGERWAGLWDFPRFAVSAARGAALTRELTDKVAAASGVAIEPGRRIATLKHGVTRFRITLDCYTAAYRGAVHSNGSRPVQRWVAPAELADFPLSVTGRQLARLIASAKSPTRLPKSAR